MGGVLHRNFGPSVTGLAWRFSEFFFDNNVCNRKRSTYLKGFFKTSSKSRIIKLLVKSRSNNPSPFTCKPLNQRTFDSIALNRQFWGPNLSKLYYWKVWEAQKFKWSYLLNKVKLWNVVKSVYTPAMTTFTLRAWHKKWTMNPLST